MFWKNKSADPTLFHETLQGLNGVEKQQMYGYPCYAFKGTIFAGFYNGKWVLKLDKEALLEAEKTFKVTLFEPLPGRKMAGYIVLPQEIVDDPAKRELWVKKAYLHASS